MNFPTYDADLCEFLTRSGVQWMPMDEASRVAAEKSWREIYNHEWPKRLRSRQGSKADFAYQQECCDHYLIVPFTSDVFRFSVSVQRPRRMLGYECRGPLLPLGAFHGIEFFIAPPDLSWTMIHTHEDHGWAGPHFIRREWRP